jgi:HAMP domain-containing protein
MTIRSRLLYLLIPPLCAFLILIACFFYFNWSEEIIESFRSRLQSIVIATSQVIPSEEIEWIAKHIHDPELAIDPTYQSYRQQLVSLKQKLPIVNLYVVQIEPVGEGEYVLSNEVQNPTNVVYQGTDPQNAFRQVILLDAAESNRSPINQPGEYDFSETDERQVYITKKSFVTPIYETRKTKERFISAYAPILNAQGEVNALLGADVGMKEIDKKLYHAWLAIFLGAGTTLLLLTSTVSYIAYRISKPVQQLNQAALEIAAGDYEANIHVKGPKEIEELANTLNTMSECLVEHMSRLRESSFVRERMYGEYECALLLQYYMLQKVGESFKHPALDLKLISMPFSATQKGLLLTIDDVSTDRLAINLLEAKESGFIGLYELNQKAYQPLAQLDKEGFIHCEWQHAYTQFTSHVHRLMPPLVWSMTHQQFIENSQQPIDLHERDMIFLCNSGVIEQLGGAKEVEEWLGRVLRHFSEDGLDVIHLMLTNELNFLAKKQQVKSPLQIVSFQMKPPEPLG